MITTFTSLRNGGHFTVKLMVMIISVLTTYYQSMVAFFPLLESTIISPCEIRIDKNITNEVCTFKIKKNDSDGHDMDAFISLYCSQ